MGFRNNNNRFVYPQREIRVKSPWKSTVYYSRPSHDLIVCLSISLLFYPSLQPGGFDRNRCPFPLLCGCDANISPELSEPSFSSPDRSAVTPPPFLKEKEQILNAIDTKQKTLLTVNVIIPHVLGREKFLITNGNRKGAKRKSLRGEVFSEKKKTSEVGGCLFPTLCLVLYAARLPAADVVASSVFKNKRETTKNVCAAALVIIVAVLFSLCLFRTGHKLRFHSEILSFTKRR